MQERENLAGLSAVEARFATMSRRISSAERKILTAVWTAPSETLLQFVTGSDLPLASAALDELLTREKSPKSPLDPKRLNAVLAQCLTSKTDNGLRTGAALLLAQRNDPRTIPILRTLLTPKDKRPLHEGAVPLRAAFLLARFKDTASYPKMRQLGPHLEDSTKRHFADLLCLMGDPASVALLGELLKNPYEGTRCHAAIAVGKRKVQRFVPTLIALLSDKYAAVRRDAAWALAAIGDKQAIPALKKASENPSETIDFKNTRLHLMATALSSQEKENSLRHLRETSRDQVMIRRALTILKNGNAVEIARDWRGNTH